VDGNLDCVCAYYGQNGTCVQNGLFWTNWYVRAKMMMRNNLCRLHIQILEKGETNVQHCDELS
jgi:hypothetical protein